MQFTIHTGLKLTPFELHHGRQPRTELTKLGKDGNSFLSDWTESSVSAAKEPKIPIYVSRNEEGYVINLVMAKTKLKIFQNRTRKFELESESEEGEIVEESDFEM